MGSSRRDWLDLAPGHVSPVLVADAGSGFSHWSVVFPVGLVEVPFGGFLAANGHFAWT